MRTSSFTVCAALAVVLFASRPAAASDDIPPEIGIGASQLLIGTATASVALAIPLFADGTPLQTVSYGILFIGPAAVGGMVCTFGQTSKHYRGDCLPVLVGAYIGALAAIPLSLLGGGADHHSFDNGDQGKDYRAGSAIGFIIGYGLGAAIGATIAWHRTKEEKSTWSLFAAPPPPPAAGASWPELRWRPAPGARSAAALTAPVLAFTF